MDAAAEYLDGALAVAVIALFLAVAHHIRETLRRRRVRRMAEQAEEWVAALAAPTTPQPQQARPEPRRRPGLLAPTNPRVTR